MSLQPTPTAYVFPGQGSQVVGMGRDLLNAFPEASRLLDMACELTGEPLRRYCLEGPLETLSRTDLLQPCIAAVSLGCLHALQAAGLTPNFVAGHSLGELIALVAAGVIDPDDALRLVCARGRLMHAASLQRPGSMTAVSDLSADEVDAAVHGSLLGPLVVANYNSPRQAALSGTREAIEAIEPELLRRGGRVTRLPVSGAWHSPLMLEANQRFQDVLTTVSFRQPQRRLFLNATGGEATSSKEIREGLARQMVSPVRWHELTQALIAAGARNFVEVGPGRVLRGLLRHIWTDYAAYSVHGVDGPLSVALLVKQAGRAA